MRPSFSAAAVDRIVQIFGGDPTTGALTSIGALVDEFETDELLSRGESFAFPTSEAVVALAGALEIGASTGYIDFYELGRPAVADLRGMFDRFYSLAQERLYRTDLTLVRRLRDRLKGRAVALDIRDENAFGQFESYLQLTDSVRHDVGCQRFIREMRIPRIVITSSRPS